MRNLWQPFSKRGLVLAQAGAGHSRGCASGGVPPAAILISDSAGLGDRPRDVVLPQGLHGHLARAHHGFETSSCTFNGEQFNRDGSSAVGHHLRWIDLCGASLERLLDVLSLLNLGSAFSDDSLS